VPTTDITQFCIWGNHSATQFPDIAHALVRKNDKTSSLSETLNDNDW
jgi:malate dehydrogenase